MDISRRSFMKAGAAVCTEGAISRSLPASLLAPENGDGLSHGAADQSPAERALAEGWEFYQGSLDPRFQIWNSEEIVSWSPVAAPHCFNHYDACDPDVPAYRGPGWYRTKLRVSNPYADGRTLLHFEGAGQRAEVYVGNQLTGRHSGGYDEFLFDITDACHSLKQDADVPLAVLCDNSRDIDRMPSDLSDFTLYGGLYRPVYLVYVPAVSLEAVHSSIVFQPGSAAQVSITARIYAPAAANAVLDLQVDVFDPKNNRVHQQKIHRSLWQGEAQLTQFELPSPQLWSPLTPNLYRCEVSYTHAEGVTTISHRFGVRHARFEEHGPFFLNGERLLLKGTHRHEDHAGYAAAVPAEVVRREMRLIKAMGANFIRLAHYQQSRLVLDLCDELGLLVWEELPWCRSGAGSALFQERGREQLRAMIDQHRNHPSVLMWGLGNEDDWPSEPGGDDHEAIRRYMTELRDLAHRLDPSRPTSYRRGEFVRDIPDIYSPSIWAGWYSGRFTEYRAALEEARKSVPHMMHIEWGADSHAGRHAEDVDPALAGIVTGKGTAEQGFDYKLTGGKPRISRDGEWSETYACDLFDWYLKTLEELPWLTGAAQWIFKDFPTPLRVDNPVPRVNQKGLVTRDMSPKESYYVFQSYWSAEPMVHIYGHNWPVRWGDVGQERLVRVYSNCDMVELSLNGVSAGVKRRNSQDFPAAGLRWSVAFREGENELRAVAHGRDGDRIDSVRFTYQTKRWGAPARLALVLKRSGDQLATVEAQMLDAAGVRCLDSRAVVRFSLAGQGRLIDNLGTPTGSRVVQMYNGRAEISLSQKARVIAAVVSEGVEPAFLGIG